MGLCIGKEIEEYKCCFEKDGIYDGKGIPPDGEFYGDIQEGEHPVYFIGYWSKFIIIYLSFY